MSKKRQAIKKSVRFEVMKRDSFTCQYCGAKAPDVVLHIDHINPVSKGGKNEIINLITSCESCNLGKSDKLLSDSSSIEKQRAQLQELNARREQLEMLLEWRDGLAELGEKQVDAIVDRLASHTKGYRANEAGRKAIALWLAKYDLPEILDAIVTASRKVPLEVTQEDADKFFNSIPRICAMSRLPEAEQRLRYARGILRNRIYFNENLGWELLRAAHDSGVDAEDLIDHAKRVKTWTEWRRDMEDFANGAR